VVESCLWKCRPVGSVGKREIEDRVREEKCFKGGVEAHCCCSLVISS
jgi:hypothetical protein